MAAAAAITRPCPALRRRNKDAGEAHFAVYARINKRDGCSINSTRQQRTAVFNNAAEFEITDEQRG
jgi:hypothetical protein